MSDTDSIGELGRYRVLREIGRGGFSIVYLAENTVLQRQVALKLLHPALFNDPAIIERFIQEARTAAGLVHPHIVRVFDLDEVDGRLFMALEYLPGGDLGGWLEANPRPGFRQCIALLAEIAAALDFAHRQGIVHGDVKPANILLLAPPDAEARQALLAAKLSDFGVLRAVRESTMTSSDQTLGTPYYISPEQAESGPANERSDQYSLGVVAYELFTGRKPFQGDTPLAIYLQHIRQAPPPPAEFNDLITPDLQAVLLRALAKDSGERYPDCAAFVRALRQAVAESERDQFERAVTEARAALNGHATGEARRELENALQILPDDPQAAALLSELETQERAQRSYAEAGQALEAARESAAAVRAAAAQHPDPDGLLSKLVPPAPSPIRRLLERWQWALYFALALLLIALLGAGGWLGYGAGPRGTLHRGTLVAGRWGTPTPTQTLTPTPTVTPTSTPTFTPTPDWGVEADQVLGGLPPDPDWGFLGSWLEIMGQGFTHTLNELRVFIGGQPAPDVDGIDSERFQVRVPSGAQAGPVQVSGSRGGDFTAGEFDPARTVSETLTLETLRIFTDTLTTTLRYNLSGFQPAGEISLTVAVQGDYNQEDEFTTVYLGDERLGQVGGQGFCTQPVTTTFTIAPESLRAAALGGSFEIVLQNAPAVEAQRCGGSSNWQRVILQAPGVADGTLVAAPESLRPDVAIFSPPTQVISGAIWIDPQDRMPLVYVPAGEFLMGSSIDQYIAAVNLCDQVFNTNRSDCERWLENEEPQHTVTLDAYWIDRTEVTNAMYAAFLNAEGNQSEGGVTWLDAGAGDVRITQTGGEWQPQDGYAEHPVVEVSWYGARAYCTWVRRRLPTEAEWEKAARGADGRTYPWGERLDCDRANYGGCGGGTLPVGSLPAGASPYGVLDMAGNVWEWVADWYDSSYYGDSPGANPTGPAIGEYRVRRGGSWGSYDRYARSADRGRGDPNDSVYYSGFRCARSP